MKLPWKNEVKIRPTELVHLKDRIMQDFISMQQAKRYKGISRQQALYIVTCRSGIRFQTPRDRNQKMTHHFPSNKCSPRSKPEPISHKQKAQCQRLNQTTKTTLSSQVRIVRLLNCMIILLLRARTCIPPIIVHAPLHALLDDHTLTIPTINTLPPMALLPHNSRLVNRLLRPKLPNELRSQPPHPLSLPLPRLDARGLIFPRIRSQR